MVLFNVSDYNTIVVMDKAVMTYEQALADAGSAFLLKKKLESKELHKLTRGAYSKIEHPDPLVLAHVLYPEAVITMDSPMKCISPQAEAPHGSLGLDIDSTSPRMRS